MSARLEVGTGRPRVGSDGFTLVEIIIAIAVFGVGVLALAAVIPLGINRNDKASWMSRASELVATRAEQALITSYGEDDLTAGTHDDPGNPLLGQFYVRWVVEDDVPVASCKRITIQCSRTSVTAPVLATAVVVTSAAGS